MAQFVSTLLSLLFLTYCFGEDLLGNYEILRSDDFELGISRTYSVFRDVRSNKTYNVHPSSAHKLSKLRSGTPMRVRGSLVSRQGHNGIGITHGDLHVSEFEEVLSSNPPQNNTAMVYRRFVMLLINLGKYNLECTAASMKDLVNGAHGWDSGLIGMTERNTGSVITYSNDLFGDDQVDIFGPFNVNYDGTCTADAWANEALNAARAQGVDISAYQNRVFALPGVQELYSTCGWHGLGNVGCEICNAWVADCTTVEVFLHELGHNLGLPHAGSNWNQAGELVEYGDPTSVMGNGWWRNSNDATWYNLPEMDYLMKGALTVVQVSESGDYQIAAFDILPLNAIYPQGIKVLHPDTGHLFYFSFHSNETVYFGKQIVVHEFTSQNTACYIIRSLPLGEIFTDKLNRITVQPIAFDGDSYVLRVSYGCVVQPTEHTLIMHAKSGDYDVTTTRDGLPYAEGETASFTLMVNNPDSPLCTPTTYSFSAVSLGDWPVSFSPPNLYLVPGQNCSVSISVSIPTGTAPAGNYLVRILGAASSGFLPADHNIAITLNTTLGPLMCTRNTPTVELSLEDVRGAVATYKLLIWNRDGFGCEPTDFAVAVELPKELTWEHKKEGKSLAAGREEEGSLVFTLHHSFYNKSFSVNVTSPHHSVITIHAELPVLSTLPCTAHTPLIRVLNQVLNMPTRAADAILIAVTNRDTLACEGSDFLVSVLDSPPSKLARITLYPTSMFLLPGQVAYVNMMVAIPIYQVETNLSIPVGVERVLQSQYFDSMSYLTLSIIPPPCETKDLGAWAWCANDGDLDNGWIQCAGLIDNSDSWNCPNLLLHVSADLPPGWKADFQQGQTMQYNPGNATWYWVNMTVPPNLPRGDYSYSFYGGELYNESSRAFRADYTLHTCTKYPLQLTPANPEIPLAAQGQTVSIKMNVHNNNTIFCEGLTVLLAAEMDKATQKLVSVTFSKNSFALGHGSDQEIYIFFTVNRTGILPLNGTDSFRTFSFNLTATDKINTTFYMSKVPVNLTVDLNCTFNPPLLLLSPLDNQLELPGDSAEGTYTVSVTNTDSEGCSPTHFFATFSGPKTFIPPSTVYAVLSPNETFSMNVTFGVDDNIPPGSYNLTATTNDGASASHVSSNISTYNIGCPVPRPIFNLTAVQFTPFLHTKTAIALAWNACENPLWCCCPCTWEIYRDGIKIGTSSGSNYTDSDRPAGSSNTYSAITIDKRGVRSPTTTTCTVSVDVHVLPPDLTKLFYFIGIVFGSTMWIIGCIFLVTMFRKSLQDKINRSVDESALLLSENSEIRDAQDVEREEDAKTIQAWTEADSRVSSDEESGGEVDEQ